MQAFKLEKWFLQHVWFDEHLNKWEFFFDWAKQLTYLYVLLIPVVVRGIVHVFTKKYNLVVPSNHTYQVISFAYHNAALRELLYTVTCKNSVPHVPVINQGSNFLWLWENQIHTPYSQMADTREKTGA